MPRWLFLYHHIQIMLQIVVGHLVAAIPETGRAKMKHVHLLKFSGLLLVCDVLLLSFGLALHSWAIRLF